MTNSGDINRRNFIALSGGALALTVLKPERSAAQGKRMLVSCLEGDPASMNSAMSSDIPALMACAPAYSWLVNVDKDGNVSPELASEWSVSDDFKVYTFKFRHNVKWHDGKPFTSADAAFTIKNMLAPVHSLAKNVYLNLASLETPDEHTLVVTFSQPNLPYLRVPLALGPMLPKHLWEGTDFIKNKLDKAPVGTGPFRFADYKIGEAIHYEANADYFGGKPAFDGLIYRIIPDPVSRSAAFENGDLDTIVGNAVPFNDIARLAALPNVALKRTDLQGVAYLGVMNLRSKPLDDVRVRKALAHAIDRKFILNNVVQTIGHSMIGPLYPSSQLYNKNLKDYAFDPELAKKLLDEAGLKPGANGVRFNLRIMWQVVYGVVARMADVIAENLRAVGVSTELSPLETGVLYQKGYVDGNFDLIIGSHALGPDPDSGLERLYNSANIKPLPNANNAAYKNEEVDRLFKAQRSAPTLEARKELYGKIQELIWADLPILPMCAYDLIGFERNDVVSGCYERFNTFGENFAKAKPKGA